MYFTQDDYKKIEQYLKNKSIKDTEFKKTSFIKGNELIPIIQNDKNVVIQADEMFDYLSLGKDNVINLTAYYDKSFKLKDAINAVPILNRKVGTIITFINENNNWRNYQFVGLNVINWNDETSWRDLYEEARQYFKGFFVSKDALIRNFPYPEEGDYAYVGVYYNSSSIFRCIHRGNWAATEERPQGANVSQEFGDSETLVISQKTITNKIREIEKILGEKIESREIIENA